MGYKHISNLYKDQTILMFKECYALEKIHGTSAHISWNADNKELHLFSGGEKYPNFKSLFNSEELEEKFKIISNSNIIIYGEAYGGKQQKMSNTYGKELKFIAFEVKIGGVWLNVPSAEGVCKSLGFEFVDYVKVSTDLEFLNAERDKPSIQAIRNGCGEKMREGIVLRPLVELTMNNGERIIAKHKGENFKETKTQKEVSSEKLKVMENAKAIAEEWVTEVRLSHILDKFPQDINIEGMGIVIKTMIEDVYREAKGEIVESKDVQKYIGSKTAILFKKRLQDIFLL